MGGCHTPPKDIPQISTEDACTLEAICGAEELQLVAVLQETALCALRYAWLCLHATQESVAGGGMAIVGPHHKVMTVWALEFRCP